MKHPNSRTGLTRYDLTRNPDGIDTPTYPATPGKAHAVIDLPAHRYSTQPQRSITHTTSTDFDWEYTAICGSTVRVLLTIPFNDSDPDTCHTCQELMRAWQQGEKEYRQKRAEITRRRREATLRAEEKEEEQRQIAAWNRAQNYRVLHQVFPRLNPE